MERIGHIWRVKPGMAEEYRRRHATIWPELEQLLRDAGVTRYTIYLANEVVFSHMEVESYHDLVERFNGDLLAQRWEEEFLELIEYPDLDSATGWPRAAVEIWTL